ncbi:MAG: hypothetical protein IKM74_01390 [Bacteroidales bacterium]|nr:hypothetical protein [Bacteroidales bacterium]
MKRIFLIIIAAIVLFSSCRKENNISTDPNQKLSFSTDTVMFDTVFTTIGSSTHQLKIYNNYTEDLNISEIRLMGGESSRFKINIDGESGSEFHDKIVPANDSLFSFLNVTIDPNDQRTPFVVEDSILFITNGNTQFIKLVAWGQNARYIVADQKINGFPEFKIVADSLEDIHWTNELPYVVYGYALINSYGTLHIEAGTHVYIHGRGGLWSWSDGQLIIDGTVDNPVIIESDRLEPFFDNEPGQWDRIWLMDGREGADHIINHAIIRNAFIGIQAESFIHETRNALRINNTILENHTGVGLYAVYYAIEANNMVIDNCGQYAFAVAQGGAYALKHCTIGNYWWKSTRTTASVMLSNYVEEDGQVYEFPLLFEMGNSIVHGAQEQEFETALSGTTVDTTYVFDHCLMKTTKFSNESPGFNSCIFNEDPLFVDYRNFDMHISDALSPAVGTGNPIIGSLVPYDLEGKSRVGVPDLGAYQH